MRIEPYWPITLVLAAVGGAHAETIHVDGVALVVRNLPGYCTVADQDLLGPMNRMMTKLKDIAVSAPCGELEAFRSGARTLGSYIVWAVGTDDSGTAEKRPATSHARSSPSRWRSRSTRPASRTSCRE